MHLLASYLGTLPSWLTLLTIAALGYVYLRGGSGTAVSGLQDTNRELVRQIHELQNENTDLRERVRTLEAMTDVATALVPVVAALEAHETRAQQRHNGTLRVLDLVAAKLGPEPNGREP